MASRAMKTTGGTRVISYQRSWCNAARIVTYKDIDKVNAPSAEGSGREIQVDKMTLRRHSLAAASSVVAAVSIALAASPAATADPAGCVPLNGAQIDSHGSATSSIGIFYDLDVTYWYQDGAVNWHKDVNGPFGTHSSGAVPTAPGNTVTIPGNGGTPLLVTVCSR
jgi:hypothetical protein